jgi:hypothetical protein
MFPSAYATSFGLPRRLHFQPGLAVRAAEMPPTIQVKEERRAHVVIAIHEHFPRTH